VCQHVSSWGMRRLGWAQVTAEQRTRWSCRMKQRDCTGGQYSMHMDRRSTRCAQHSQCLVNHTSKGAASGTDLPLA
jgi:hypothetical protein